MKRLTSVLCLTVAFATLSVSAQQRNVIRARAILFDSAGQQVGTVLFTQSPADDNFPTPEVNVVARVEGLTPGLHGFHVHETGVCVPPNFATAGGHFDPGPAGNSTPVDANHPFHTGDLPNLEVNNAGIGHLRATTSRFTLSLGGNSVFDVNGSAVVVHQNPDLGVTGLVGASGGPRVACGVIEPD
jgi:superoxide dismutase, Cu-Zn family